MAALDGISMPPGGTQDPPACDLADDKCVPCRGGVPPLRGEQLSLLKARISDEWQLVDEHHLTRTFKFKDFAEALAFVDRIGRLAEDQGHHPTITLAWGRVTVETYTHKIDGLTKSDFVLAAKIDRL